MHYALRAGTLVDPELGRLHDQILTIREGRFAQVSPAEHWHEPGVDVLDFSDKVIAPGYVDCHEHLTISGGDEVEQATRPAPRQAITATVIARKMLASGITTARTLGDAHQIDVITHRAIEEGLIPGPRIIPAVAPVARTGGHAHFIGGVADGEVEVRRLVRKHLSQGAVWIKVMASGGNSTPGSDPMVQEFTDAELRAIGDEALRAGLDVAAHLHGGPAVDVVIEAGYRSIEHGAYLTEAQLDKVAEAGVWIVSTVGIGRSVADDPDAPAFYREKAQRALERRLWMLREARARGVKVVVGCDGNHGRIDVEAQALADAGYTPAEVLRALTLEGARMCRIEKSHGSIEAGKVADFAVLSGDPLHDPEHYGSVEAVYKEGVAYS